MKQFVYICILCASVVVTSPANGQSLNTYIDLAGKENPRLKAAFFSYQAALQRVPQVGALPDPQVSFGLFVRPMQQMMGNQVAQVSVMQMFPWVGTREAAKNESALRAKAKFDAFQNVKSLVFYEVKSTWYALYLIEEKRRITTENLKIMKSLETIAINRFKSGAQSGGGPTSDSRMTQENGMGQMGDSDMGGGKSDLVDVLRTQMTILELENQLHLLTDSKGVLTAQFNKLLNRVGNAEVVLPDSLVSTPVPAPLAQIPDSIVANNPMLKVLIDEEQAFEEKKKMKRKMGFPSVGVGIQYGILRPRSGNLNAVNGRDMMMPMVAINVPIWRKKYRASVEEAQLEGKAVGHAHQEAKNTLMVDYEEALRDFRDAERRDTLFQKQAALAEQALNILTVSYGAGAIPFEDVLQMQLKLLNFRLSQVNAVVDRNISVAMLERLMGR